MRRGSGLFGVFDRPSDSRHNWVVTITLASDVEEFLEEQVRAGACANAADLVNEVLRSLREQRQKTFEVTPELEAWLLQAAEQPATPVTAADFEGIRQRAKTRAAAKGT